MQTHLPWMSFDDSAGILDYRRLNKQRMDSMHILETLMGVKVANTTVEERTGRYRQAYFDPDGYEIEPDEMNPGDVDLDLFTHDLVPIMRTVQLPRKQWKIVKYHPPMNKINHPVVGIWRGYEFALLKFQEAVIDVWIYQYGFEDTTLDKMEFMFENLYSKRPRRIKFPPWLGYEPLHQAYQSNLVRLDPDHYEPLFPGVPDNLPYIYPRSSRG